MHYNQFMSTVADSRVDQWKRIDVRDGPVPSLGFAPEREHRFQAIYLPNISIGLAFGASQMDDLSEWSFPERFRDHTAWPSLTDLLWNGTLVHRELGVAVDGGRITLPFPETLYGHSGKVVHTTTAFAVALFRLQEALVGSADSFDWYLRLGGIKVPSSEERERLLPDPEMERAMVARSGW